MRHRCNFADHEKRILLVGEIHCSILHLNGQNTNAAIVIACPMRNFATSLLMWGVSRYLRNEALSALPFSPLPPLSFHSSLPLYCPFSSPLSLLLIQLGLVKRFRIIELLISFQNLQTCQYCKQSSIKADNYNCNKMCFPIGSQYEPCISHRC